MESKRRMGFTPSLLVMRSSAASHHAPNTPLQNRSARYATEHPWGPIPATDRMRPVILEIIPECVGQDPCRVVVTEPIVFVFHDRNAVALVRC